MYCQIVTTEKDILSYTFTKLLRLQLFEYCMFFNRYNEKNKSWITHCSDPSLLPELYYEL